MYIQIISNNRMQYSKEKPQSTQWNSIFPVRDTLIRSFKDAGVVATLHLYMTVHVCDKNSSDHGHFVFPV